jgi:hypothetical protein
MHCAHEASSAHEAPAWLAQLHDAPGAQSSVEAQLPSGRQAPATLQNCPSAQQPLGLAVEHGTHSHTPRAHTSLGGQTPWRLVGEHWVTMGTHVGPGAEQVLPHGHRPDGNSVPHGASVVGTQ